MIGHSAFPTKRGELRRLYVKQLESAHVDEFSKMSDAVPHNPNGRSISKR